MTKLSRFLAIVLGLTFAFSAQSFDVGDGSDGSCNWTVNTTLTKALYQCEDLFIDTGVTVDVDPSVTDVLEIKVQGDITIDGTLDLSANGTVAGPGGGNGGSGGDPGDGAPGVSPPGVDSFGKGGADNSAILTDCGGGGGSGGLHSGNLVVNGGDSGNDPFGGCTDGGGASPPTQSYGNPQNFQNVIHGGSGGGGGGSGSNSGGGEGAGGDGGGGGGALRLYAGGNITIEGEIIANGDDGANATIDHGGGGGGGSGGALYIVSLKDMIIGQNAILSTQTGNGGTGSNEGGDGSSGDNGYIRLEDDDGQITIHPDATIEPSPTTEKNPASLAQSQAQGFQNFQSDIATGCALRESQENSLTLILIFSLGFIVLFVKNNRPAIFGRRRSLISR